MADLLRLKLSQPGPSRSDTILVTYAMEKAFDEKLDQILGLDPANVVEFRSALGRAVTLAIANEAANCLQIMRV